MTPKSFRPENTDTVLYVHPGLGHSLAYLIEMAQEKWGDEISLEEIDISTEYIQTECIGYDLYDPSDYTAFITITKKG